MWMKFNSEIIVWSLHGPGCVWTPQLSPKNSHLVRFGTVNGRYPLWFAHIGFTTISIHSASLIVIFDKFLFLYFCCFFLYKLKWSLLNMYILWCILTTSNSNLIESYSVSCCNTVAIFSTESPVRMVRWSPLTVTMFTWLAQTCEENREKGKMAISLCNWLENHCTELNGRSIYLW